jgi:cell division protease FtsH
MGHALVAASLPGTDPVHKISIIPRGIGALGYTLQRPTDDRYLMTREELEAKLAVLLGGRAAEFLVFGHLSTGASDDLSRATEIARSMVTSYALVPELGNVTWAESGPNFLGVPAAPSRSYSEDTAREIDRAVRGLVDSAFDRASEILATALEHGARLLLEKDTLDGAELGTLFEKVERDPA